MDTIGKKLKAIRLSKELTQEAIASRLEISLPAYSKIERDITDISLSRLEQIGAIFGMTSIEILAFGTEEKPKSKDATLSEKDEIISLQKKIITMYEKKSEQ